MKKISSILFLIFILISCKESKPKEYYTINGKIENLNGKIYLIKAINEEYYSNNFVKDSAIVVNGKFEFRLSIKNNIPLPFHIETENTRTFRFLLEPKDQQIIIDSLYFNVSPKIVSKNSTIQNEILILKERKSLALKEFNTEFKKIRNPNFPKDSIEKFAIIARKKLSYESYLILTNFIKDFPNSYVGFWEIAIAQMYNGINKELENGYNNLSTKIKQTDVAKVLDEHMFNAKTLKIGSYFPTMKLKNKELNEIMLVTNENSNYTLIDFWFSFCSPCIAQFPKLKELQSKYNSKQLKIISISTDKTKHIDNWYKVMEQKNITWLNLLDENGVSSSPLGINSFPTNFLLNKDGVIIKRDISLTDLEELLENFE
tara:strand:+ start:2242 stop:3360 length:1119 start_codon:yes stop_codon:yes gene_type:complete